MYDMSNAYGRATSSALDQFNRRRKKMEEEAYRGLSAGGARADQLLRARKDLYGEGIAGAGDIYAGMGLQQAQAEFGAETAATEAAKSRDFEKMMSELGFGQQKELAGMQRGWDVEDRDLAMKMAKRQQLWDLLGTLGSAAIPVVGGLIK